MIVKTSTNDARKIYRPDRSLAASPMNVAFGGCPERARPTACPSVDRASTPIVTSSKSRKVVPMSLGTTSSYRARTTPRWRATEPFRREIDVSERDFRHAAAHLRTFRPGERVRRPI